MTRLSHWLMPALCAALMMLTAPTIARAQAPVAKPVGLSGLPREVTAAAVTSSGELLIAGDFPGAQSMAQVVAGATLFQVQPVLFEEASMGELKLKHVAVSEDDATWALADDATRVIVYDAHRAALASSLEFVEQRVVRTRIGDGGRHQVRTRGMVAAAFARFPAAISSSSATR